MSPVTEPAQLPEVSAGQKLCHFGRCVAEAKLLCVKSFVPVTRAGVFTDMEKFSSRLQRSRSQKPRSRNRASPAFHMNRHRNFYDGKSGEARPRKPNQPG